jgi:hypothetical protein
MSADESKKFSGEGDNSLVNCNACAHYFITWNKKFPYGCGAMKFMSSKLPSADVLEIEGHECFLFEHKDAKVESREVVRKNRTEMKQVNVIV